MPNVKQICLALVLVCAPFSTVGAQDSSSSTQRSTLTITVAASGERVRITAPSSVVQMHVEVYAASGEKLFDQEIRGGNVFDWHLQDGQARRLAPGAYVCVVTAKSVSGKLTQKLGAVTVAEQSASLQAAGPLQLSLQQTQAIGPVEADSSWTIAGNDEPQTATVIANDGSEGQMIRGRGALTFRIGNFFSGIDQEQMRLTEAGDLGIGTSQPQAKLDVAGAIRAERFLVAKPKLAGGDKTSAGTAPTESTDSVQPLIAGTGTQNRIAKWVLTDTLGDSGITETAGGNVGIGTTVPNVPLEVNGIIRQGVANGISLGHDAGRNRIVGSASQPEFQFVNFNNAYAGIGSRAASIGNSFAGTAAPTNGVIIEGNVGIGTATPGSKLSVVIPNEGFIAGFGANGAPDLLKIGYSSGAVSLTSSPFGPLVLNTQNNKHVLLLPSGNVGIGTPVPGAKLDVAGDINAANHYNLAGQRVLSLDGTQNTFLGREAGFSNMAGVNNSFFGRAAGLSNTSGSNNSFVGLFAGLSNTEGSNNSFIGSGGGLFSTEGSDNTFIGKSAGQTNTTGSGNTIIGANANVGAPNLTNATAIGAGAVVNNSFSTVISGDTTVLSGANVEVPFNLKVGTLHLQSGIGTVGGSACFSDPVDGYSVIGRCLSSRRYKTNIARLGFGLDLVRRLRPITFDWKEGGKHDLGLIAEDVAAIEPLLVTYDTKGQVEGVKYDRVGVLLVNAVQEQQVQIAQQQHTIETLQQQNAQMKVRNAETVARLAVLETVVKRMTRHHRRHQERRS